MKENHEEKKETKGKKEICVLFQVSNIIRSKKNVRN